VEIQLDPDGRWKDKISVGPSPGPRSCVIILVKVDDFIHELFQDIKDRSRKGNNHGPVVMNPPKKLFSVVQELVLEVRLPQQKPS
jgi:hypothetical protein